MPRYIDAYKIPYHDLSDGRGKCEVAFLEDIIKVPTADVRENIRGEWIIEDNIVPINFIDGYVETKRCICSNCGYKPTYMGRTILPTTKTLLFCPNCGADMRGKV